MLKNDPRASPVVSLESMVSSGVWVIGFGQIRPKPSPPRYPTLGAAGSWFAPGGRWDAHRGGIRRGPIRRPSSVRISKCVCRRKDMLRKNASALPIAVWVAFSRRRRIASGGAESGFPAGFRVAPGKVVGEVFSRGHFVPGARGALEIILSNHAHEWARG